MNKTTEALKLAEEACEAGIETGKIIAVYAAKTGNDDLAMQFLGDSKFDRALAVIREARAEPVKQETPYCKCAPMCAKPCVDESCVEPVKQEPVAYMVKAHDSVQRFAVRDDVADEFACKWRETYPDADFYPLYAAPVDAKAIRAEALEEAAKVCDDISKDYKECFIKYDDVIDAGKRNASNECAAAIRGLK